jgi:hypothetical protein
VDSPETPINHDKQSVLHIHRLFAPTCIAERDGDIRTERMLRNQNGIFRHLVHPPVIATYWRSINQYALVAGRLDPTSFVSVVVNVQVVQTKQVSTDMRILG